jgi:S1-C subfamily serine protease
VLRVEPGTPAEGSGVREGDLLVSVNASPIVTLDDLQRVMVLSAEPQLDVEVMRSGARHRLSIRPALRRAA